MEKLLSDSESYKGWYCKGKLFQPNVNKSMVKICIIWWFPVEAVAVCLNIIMMFDIRVAELLSLFTECCHWIPGSFWLSEQCQVWNIVGSSWCCRVLPQCRSTVFARQVRSITSSFHLVSKQTASTL